jgi:hypothetical protein
MNPQYTICLFSRQNIEERNFSDFLGAYSLNLLPKKQPLAEMMGTIEFMFHGYDNQAEELCTIPEVRRFCIEFHAAWPYWLYFCNLKTDCLRIMYYCCLESLVVIHRDGSRKFTADYEIMELANFIYRDFIGMNEMFERAGLTVMANYDRTKAIMEYFNLPFNATPPG